MDCPECGARDTIEIEIRLEEDRTVQFHSCRNCETKWWQSDGSTVALDEVLTTVARRRK